jgi:hypothetical protein
VAVAVLRGALQVAGPSPSPSPTWFKPTNHQGQGPGCQGAALERLEAGGWSFLVFLKRRTYISVSTNAKCQMRYTAYMIYLVSTYLRFARCSIGVTWYAWHRIWSYSQEQIADIYAEGPPKKKSTDPPVHLLNLRPTHPPSDFFFY